MWKRSETTVLTGLIKMDGGLRLWTVLSTSSRKFELYNATVVAVEQPGTPVFPAAIR